MRPLTRPALAVAVGAALLVSSACNPGRPPAATVAGTDISSERLDDLVAAFVEADPDTYRAQIEGDGQGTYRMAAVSAILSTLVLQVAQSELAEEAGATPSDAERSEAEELVRTSFVAGAEAPADPAAEASPEQAEAQETSAAIFDALPDDTREWLVDLRAATLALGRVAQDQVDDDATADEDDPLCLRAIVVEEAQVEAVQQRLDDGEDFGAVSAEVTIDPQLAQAEGSLGQDCLTAAGYEAAGLQPELVSVIGELDFGEVSEPVDIDEGVVALFEVRRDPDGALAALVQESIGDVEVRVDPRYGTWDAETGTITPPDGATAPETELIDGGTATATVPAG